MVKDKKDAEKVPVKFAQKNFRLPEEFMVEWERWCLANGYDEKLVFHAALAHFQGLTHEQRTELFQRILEQGGSITKRRSDRLE